MPRDVCPSGRVVVEDDFLPAYRLGHLALLRHLLNPPNAIVYGSGYVPMIRMIRTGVIADLATIPLILLATYGIGSAIGLGL